MTLGRLVRALSSRLQGVDLRLLRALARGPAIRRAVGVAMFDEQERPFSDDFGSFGSDVDLLAEAFPKVRAWFVMLRRNAWRAHIPAEMRRNTADVLNSARVKMRVMVSLPHGMRWPRSERDAITFMEMPEIVRTELFATATSFKDIRGTDPRVVSTIRRATREAVKLGVPLVITDVAVPKEQQAREWLSGASPFKPGEAPYHRADAVQVGHVVFDKGLPWECWDAIDAFVARAGDATGYPLAPLGLFPGEYRLADDCPKWAPQGDELRPKKLSSDEARSERDRLVEYYLGGHWVDEDGVIHEDGDDREDGDTPAPALVGVELVGQTLSRETVDLYVRTFAAHDLEQDELDELVAIIMAMPVSEFHAVVRVFRERTLTVRSWTAARTRNDRGEL